ncbi:MAG: GntP family permease [Actinomycetaceae bacterium]|nr:GntP family permease [Actinomycetaceae bacterium]
MDDWQQTMSTGPLLGIAVAAIALILILVIRFKMHAFLTLVIVSILTAIATGIPIEFLYDTVMDGFNTTLGQVGILVGLGAMLGKLVEDSGGAQVLADSMLKRFGEKRAPLALGIASLILGFPMFFDAGLVVMLPIVFAVAKRLGGPILLYGIPAAAAFSVMHVFVPPHPGPIAASTFYNANLGFLLIAGIIVAVPAFYLTGVLWGRYCARKYPHIDIKNTIFGAESEPVANPPKTGTVISMLLLPMFLILLNTSVDFMTKAGMFGRYYTDAELEAAEEAGRTLTQADPPLWADVFTLLGRSGIALLIAVLVAIPVLGSRRGTKGSALEKLLDSALGPIASVVFITGAGGMFGGVLRASGIGDALKESMTNMHIPTIFAAFLIAVALRLAQGSATVALTTAAGLMSSAVLDGNYSALQVVAITLATAAGSVFAGHVNDSGFWLVGRLMGMDTATTLRVWTVQQALESVVVFVFSLAIYALGAVVTFG